ncbi:MAG: S1 RNA-binding domain-containing protein [Acidobacteria bacterium]|nr:S1 RNA-binding domain-containing protein [Acidobacteriota bacterium]
MSAELSSADLEEPIPDNQGEAAGATPEVTAAAEPVEKTGAAVATEKQPAAKDAGNDGAQSQGGVEVEKIRAAMQSGSSVKGKVIGWSDGGLQVVVGGVAAFCPDSEMEFGEPLEAKEYVDQTYDFFVLRIEDDDEHVMLSRVSHLRQEQKAQQAATRGQIEVDAVLTGKVVSIKDFGAFVDLGGVQGLVHISELARRRVQRTEDVVQPGDEVQVKVLKLDKGGRRISLSMRALEPDPWREVSSKYTVGSTVDGKVEKVERFGAFVQLEPGLSGLLPSSKMSIPAGTSASRVFRPGRELKVQIISIDARRRRISLGLEGDGAEGSSSDFEAYRSNQAASSGGFNALAAALSKIQP